MPAAVGARSFRCSAIRSPGTAADRPRHVILSRMFLDSLGELEDKRPWSTGAQSRRSCHRRSCAACFEQLAGVFASCGDRHIINYLPGSLSSEENLQMYRNDYSDNEPDIPGCQRRSVPVSSGAPQFALWASAADRPRNVMHSWQSTL